MIRYDLICEKGHEFDAWFSGIDAYDQQRKRGFVECSQCGSNRIEKQIMAPNVGVRSNKSPSEQTRMMTPPADPRLQAMMTMMREMRRQVEANAQDVGDKFVEEARKIHYNESDKRGIYGSATLEDARSLLEEGIEVMPLPSLPEDGN
jgi:hypothetical protein